MPPSQDQEPVEWVTEATIRKCFNDGRFAERVTSGELTTIVKWHSHADPPPTGEPLCTHSQMVYYCAPDGHVVALVHQYLRPDGTIGASGLPDPKRLILRDRIISVRSEPSS